MTRVAIHNTQPDPADAKLDAFLDGLSTLVANAVKDGIEAGLKGKLPEKRDDVRNQDRPRGMFRAPSESGFKVPKAVD